MKSWISFLIPDDEYKEKRILYFLAEGGILLFLFLALMIICNKYVSIDLDTILLSSISIFLFYVFGRYIIAGIEYTEVATKKDYKKELRSIFIKTITFVLVFMLLYLIIISPSNRNEWIELVGILFSVSIVMFFVNFISLNRSYNKNKKLL